MKKNRQKSMAAWCAVAMLMTIPGMYVLADDMAEEELIVTEAEVQAEIVDSVDSPEEIVTDDSDAPIAEENIGEEEVEEIVGVGSIQVGDGVTATFDADTGAVEFTSQDGVLLSEWSDKLGVDRKSIKSIKVVSGTVYLPDDSRYMFYDCNALTGLDLSGFDKSNVTNMYAMFAACSSLTSLDLSSFDTSKVMDMGELFYECENLTSIDLSNFDTSNAIYMDYMFYNCYKLTSLDLSNFNT